MKILVDENIPFLTVESLRKLGHDVLDIRGTPDEGTPDDDLWSKSQIQERLLITTDKGFSKHRNEFHYWDTDHTPQETQLGKNSPTDYASHKSGW